MTLPTFLLVGAAKAGTTSLADYLGQHPEIFMSPVKEPNFFAFEGQSVCFTGPGDEGINRRTITDLASYRRLFEASDDQPARGEASVVYLVSARAPERIRQHIPSARIVMILRDPVERAYSSYLYMQRDGREPLDSFREALAAEPARIAAGWQHIWWYVEAGFYGRQVARYLRQFPRDQILVLFYEHLRLDPAAVLSEVFKFLGVDPCFRPDTSIRHTPSGLPRSRVVHGVLSRPLALKSLAKRILPSRAVRRTAARLRKANLRRPHLDSRLEVELRRVFHDDIEYLGELLDEDLSRWQAPGIKG